MNQILGNVVMVFGDIGIYEGICVSKRIMKLLGSEISDYENAGKIGISSKLNLRELGVRPCYENILIRYFMSI